MWTLGLHSPGQSACCADRRQAPSKHSSQALNRQASCLIENTDAHTSQGNIKIMIVRDAMHPCHACTLHTELPEGWYGAGAVDQGALEVHGHVAGKPGRPARLAALPAAHPPVVQPHCTAAQASANPLLRSMV